MFKIEVTPIKPFIRESENTMGYCIIPQLNSTKEEQEIIKHLGKVLELGILEYYNPKNQFNKK